MTHALRLDASMRRTGSVTRDLTDRIVAALAPQTVTVRDLADGVPLITEDWIGANFTDPDARTDDQRAILAHSDALVAELEAADTIVIGLPIYNFGVPAALKAWVDLIARARRTFRYTETGPEGLLRGKRAIIAVASGGTAVDGAGDLATPYLRQALGFVGITDVTVIDAGRMMSAEAADTRAAADAAITALAA